VSTLSKQDIERLFQLLNKELRSASISGEVYLVGGAVMCLVFGARESTRIGEEFQDLDDIRYLLATLACGSTRTLLKPLRIIIHSERFPPKALYALEELLHDSDSNHLQ